MLKKYLFLLLCVGAMSHIANTMYDYDIDDPMHPNKHLESLRRLESSKQEKRSSKVYEAFENEQKEQIKNRATTQPLDMELVDQVIKSAPEDIKDLIPAFQNLASFKKGLLKGIMFIGEPGVGKSLLARALAVKCNVLCLHIDCSLLANEYQNSGSQNLKRALEPAFLKRPIIIILDEVGSLFEVKEKAHDDRDRIAKAFLQLFDDLQHENPFAIVIGTTNSIEHFPNAVQSRFKIYFEIPMPSYETRKNICQFYLERQSIDFDNKLLDIFACQTQHCSIRDIECLIDLVLLEASNRTKSYDDIHIFKVDIINAYKKLKRSHAISRPSWYARTKKFISENPNYVIGTLQLGLGVIALMQQNKAIYLSREGLATQKTSVMIGALGLATHAAGAIIHGCSIM